MAQVHRGVLVPDSRPLCSTNYSNYSDCVRTVVTDAEGVVSTSLIAVETGNRLLSIPRTLLDEESLKQLSKLLWAHARALQLHTISKYDSSVVSRADSGFELVKSPTSTLCA